MAALPGASTKKADLLHLNTTFFRRQGEDQLVAKTLYFMFGEERDIDRNSGDILQLYRYSVTGTNTVASTEGEVKEGLQLKDIAPFTVTPSRYTDYVTLSRHAKITAIDDVTREMVRQMSIRAATSIDLLTRTTLDTTTVTSVLTPLDSTMTRDNLGQAATNMENAEIERKMDGLFPCVMSPLVAFDLMHDADAGSVLDVSRGQGLSEQSQKFIKSGDRGRLMAIDDCLIFKHTQVTTPSGAATKRRVYFLGKDTFATTAIAGDRPKFVADPKNQNFNVKVFKSEGSMQDPNGEIAVAAGIQFYFAAIGLDSVDPRGRQMDVESRLVS